MKDNFVETRWLDEKEIFAVFAHGVAIPNKDYENADLVSEARKWCVSQFGADMILDVDYVNGVWSYLKRVQGSWGFIHMDDHALFLFKDDAAAVEFKLRFV